MRILPLVFLIALPSLPGCAPSCGQTCKKVLDCELDSPRTTTLECRDDCERQRSLYEDWWKDEEKVEQFEEHRRCLMQSTCDQLAAGACYDEELFLF